MEFVLPLLEPRPLGVYVHVPFCATACEFCAFYQEKPRRGDLDRYLAGMESAFQRQLAPVVAKNRAAYSQALVFWGGGTPGLLPAEDLIRLGSAMKSTLGDISTAEWTVELAPSVVKPAKIEALLSLGVTRFSMGVQSFEPRILEAMGRIHSPAQILTAHEVLRACGVNNLNLDLIFAVPGQSFEDWERDLDNVLELAPQHISTYCLTFEEDTKLYAKLMRGQIHRRSAQAEAEFYLRTWKKLAAGGFQQYEVSNFARPGYACLHNLNTWHMGEWIGIGPSAAGQFEGLRYQHFANLDKWLTALDNHQPTIADPEVLTGEILGSDALIFGLRLNAGVSWAAWKARFRELSSHYCDLENLWTKLVQEDLLERDWLQTGQLRVTESGRLVLDAIGSRILDCV